VPFSELLVIRIKRGEKKKIRPRLGEKIDFVNRKSNRCSEKKEGGKRKGGFCWTKGCPPWKNTSPYGKKKKRGRIPPQSFRPKARREKKGRGKGEKKKTGPKARGLPSLILTNPAEIKSCQNGYGKGGKGGKTKKGGGERGKDMVKKSG